MIPASHSLVAALMVVFCSCSPNKSLEQQPAAAVSFAFDIPFSPDVSIDGIKSNGEWEKSYVLPIPDGDTFYIKHDGLNLCIGYSRSPNRLLFPELLIDRGNGKPSMWNGHQQWYHVSGSDCFSDLSYADYGTATCSPVHSDWDAKPNFLDPNNIPLFVEIKIPFDKLRVDFKGGDRVIGIAFCLTDAQSALPQVKWPDSMNVHFPATWGTGTLQ